MDNTYVNISEAVEEAKKYFDHEVVVGDKTFTIGIRHGLTLTEMFEFVDICKEASLDEDGNYDEMLHNFAFILTAIKYFTNIDPEIDQEDLVLFWEASNIRDVINSVTNDFNKLDWASIPTDPKSEKEKLFEHINNFLEELNNTPGVDENAANKIADKIANADWQEIVGDIVNIHEDEWDSSNGEKK